METPNEPQTTQRGLKNRHIQIIAIAGTIGTGLFLGAGKSISLAGPAILIPYIFIGILMYIFLRCLGEMLYADPKPHSFLNFTGRYLGEKMGFFAQWTYWLVVIFMAMAELTAIGNYLQLWLPNVPTWITELSILALLFLLNTLNSRFFGETEFWFGMIKIVAIVGLIVTAVIMVVVGFKSSHGTASIANITNNFEMFPHGVGSFMESFQMVMFAFVAMEFIGMTVAETENPRPTLKKAVHQVPYRILIFYVGALLAIMSILPWRNIIPDRSPFVTIFQAIGINWAAALINFVVLTSAASALNSALFSTARNLYSLSKNSPSLSFFRRLSGHKIPFNALTVTTIAVATTPFISFIPGFSDSFTAITSAATDLFLIVYIITLFTFLKFRKSKDYMPDGFKVPAANVLVPITIVAFALIFLSLFFFKASQLSAFLTVIWAVVFGLVSYFKRDASIGLKK